MPDIRAGHPRRTSAPDTEVLRNLHKDRLGFGETTYET